jgi:hypothetical protein
LSFDVLRLLFLRWCFSYCQLCLRLSSRPWFLACWFVIPLLLTLLLQRRCRKSLCERESCGKWETPPRVVQKSDYLSYNGFAASL